jgi:hypothetical protein
VKDLLLKGAGKSLKKPHWHDGQNEEGKARSPTDQTVILLRRPLYPKADFQKYLGVFFEFVAFEIVLDLGRIKGEYQFVLPVE